MRIGHLNVLMPHHETSVNIQVFFFYTEESASRLNILSATLNTDVVDKQRSHTMDLTAAGRPSVSVLTLMW